MSDKVSLSLAELEAYRGQGSGKSSGKYLRFYCPVHGSESQHSLMLDPDSGRFKCFSCLAWGYLEEYSRVWQVEKAREREQAFRDQARQKSGKKNSPSKIPLLQSRPAKPVSKSPVFEQDLKDKLRPLQQALPGSIGERYLHHRGISLQAAQACDLGYAAEGAWPHIGKSGRYVRQYKWGRLVFPHTTPEGQVVNLYGRAVAKDGAIDKKDKHDHLPGAKGVFMAQNLAKENVYICEGPFDALSLVERGFPAVAVFGLDGLRWDWVKATKIIFAFDQDVAGQKWQDLALEGLLRGKEVYWLPPKSFGGCKDINEAHIQGVLALDTEIPETPHLQAEVDIPQVDEPEKLDEAKTLYFYLLEVQEKYGFKSVMVEEISQRLAVLTRDLDSFWDWVFIKN